MIRNRDQWFVSKSISICEKSPWLNVIEESLVNSSGLRIDDYYLIEMPSYTIVIASKDDHLLMLDGYRRGVNSNTLTFPGGMIEVNEEPLDCALREFSEETSFTAQSATKIGKFVGNTSRKCGVFHVFHIDSPVSSDPASFPDLENPIEVWIPRLKLVDFIDDSRISGAEILAAIGIFNLKFC